MKKRAALDIIAILSLIGAHYVQYFTVSKIGFVRWLNYNNNKLHELLPLGTIKYAALAIILILMVIAIAGLIRNKSKLNILDWAILAAMCIVAVYYIYVTRVLVYEVTKSAFLIVPLIGLAALLLVIRNLVRAADLKKTDNA